MYKKETLVSVIVPVYNTEIYLEQCIKSILNQTLQELEIIFVDDGSTDSSLDILMNYSEKDSRIQILRQENKYAGAARNYGMSVAKGKYCLFLDADDFFEESMIETMYQQCEKAEADMCICRGRIYDKNLKRIVAADHFLNMKIVPKELTFNWSDIPEKIFNFTSPAPWTKLFRREFIQRENLEFQILKRSNDLYFCNMALALAKKITVVDKILVNYRKGHSFSLQATNAQTPFDFYEAMLALKEGLIKHNIFEEVKQSFVNFCLGVCLYNLNAAKSSKDGRIIYEKLKTEIFNKLQIYGHECTYYYNQGSFQQMQEIILNSPEDKMKEIEDNIRIRKAEVSRTEPADLFEMDSSLKVSVIIPIYNVEEYIEECVHSVMKQTLRDIEILCINDGSSDRSMEIVEQLNKKENRIVISNKENGGLSSARNAGMEIAKGEFILFLDSDDYLADCALEYLYRQAKYYQLDELFYNADVFYDSINALEEFPNYQDYYKRNASYEKVMSGQDLFIQMKKNKDFKPSACLQILNRDFLNKNKIKFYEGILHEDNLFTLQCISLAKKAKFVDVPLYMRRVREGSIMTTQKGWNNAMGYYMTIKEMEEFIKANQFKDNDIFLETLLNHISDLCIFATTFLSNIEEDEILSYIRNLELEDRIQFTLWIYSVNRSEGKRKASEAKVKNLNTRLEKEKKKSKEKIAKVKNSITFRIGRLIMWLPRKLVKLIRG